jgi:hypothetical protein
MKPLVIAGIVVALLGVFVLSRDVSYPMHRTTMRVGDVGLSVQEQRTVPPWAGVVAVGGGALMIGAGLRRRKT